VAEASDDLRDNYAATFAGNRLGFGRRPALLLIDFLAGYTTEGSPFYAPGVRDALANSIALLAAARAAAIPVVHTNVRYGPGLANGGMFVRKIPALACMVEGNPLAAFCAGVEPLASETVISKQYASAFFATSLAPLLTARGVDTTILAGCTTSGCIRASAIDAISHGFRPIVVRECVGDRHPAPHQANLFDIDAKYGDVVGRAEAIAYLEGLGSSAAG